MVWGKAKLRFSLITAFFPEWDETRHEKLLLRWVPSADSTAKDVEKPAGFYAPYLPDILGKLDHEEDGTDFSSLKNAVDDFQRQEFVLNRVGMNRARAAHWTPKCLKRLKPEGGTLVWQVATSAFQAYYPIPKTLLDEKAKSASKKGKGKIKTMWSTHRGYLQKRTKLKALQEVVKWLWKHHEDCGGVTQAWFIAPLFFSCFSPSFGLTII